MDDSEGFKVPKKKNPKRTISERIESGEVLEEE